MPAFALQGKKTSERAGWRAIDDRPRSPRPRPGASGTPAGRPGEEATWVAVELLEKQHATRQHAQCTTSKTLAGNGRRWVPITGGDGRDAALQRELQLRLVLVLGRQLATWSDSACRHRTGTHRS